MKVNRICLIWLLKGLRLEIKVRDRGVVVYLHSCSVRVMRMNLVHLLSSTMQTTPRQLNLSSQLSRVQMSMPSA